MKKIINDLIKFSPSRSYDNRGYFEETYNKIKCSEQGIEVEFVQDNYSMSNEAGTIRGLHFQVPPFDQGKLVRCGRGAIYDVALDIRKGSPTYGKWEGHELTAENGDQLYIPSGFAHGFITLKPKSEIIYKCTNFYDSNSEGSIRWDDPDIAINWPIIKEPIISNKDAKAPLFSSLKSPFIYSMHL